MSNVTSIVGGIMQSVASVLERKKMYEEYKKQLARMEAYKNRGGEIFSNAVTRSGSEPAKRYIQDRATAREGFYGNVSRVPLDFGGQGEPTLRDLAANMLSDKLKAQELAYNDWLFKLGIGNQGAQRELTYNNQAATGLTNNVFPYKMYDAQNSQAVLRGIGQALGASGSIADMAMSKSGAADGKLGKIL